MDSYLDMPGTVIGIWRHCFMCGAGVNSTVKTTGENKNPDKKMCLHPQKHRQTGIRVSLIITMTRRAIESHSGRVNVY